MAVQDELALVDKSTAPGCTARSEPEAATPARTEPRDLLALCDAEATILGMRLMLADELRQRRLQRGFSQAALAKMIGSSQSRIAKLEGGDPSASLELLLRAVIATGARAKLRLW